IVVSPWHLGRHEDRWSEPDAFDPSRWEDAAVRKGARDAWLPFSAGPRVCPGAGFAMIEASVLLAVLMSRFRFETIDRPVPVAHLTVRSRDGIRLRVSPA
ncbi:MAG: cytochrome P450, partial [Silicimonas sp.]|nr:cytochrome P450 [Silicimonas sp.]